MRRPNRTGRRRWTDARGSISARGLVPFLDTLFNLLFALLAISVARAPSSFDLLRLRLPQVEPGGERASAAAGLVVEVDSDGTVRPAGSDMVLHSPTAADMTQLDRALVALVGESVPEEVPIEIRAEAQCPHGVVVELLQHLRVAGFSDVRLAAVTQVPAWRGAAEGGAR
jgi:biopolymer transport protein ExbD